MLYNGAKCCLLSKHFSISTLRQLTTAEVSTALRPFYFSVHPDLFGKHPTERVTNENSLKQLSSFLENLRLHRAPKPCDLSFYIRDKESVNGDSFRYIKIRLNEKDIRLAVTTILKSCRLSTAYVDKLQPPPKPSFTYTIRDNVRRDNVDAKDPAFGNVRESIKEAKDALALIPWLDKNVGLAQTNSELHKPIRGEVSRLRKILCDEWGLVDVRWECGWNEQHFRGCLQSLKALADQHPQTMLNMKGRILVFAPFTGVSLDGHIMLSSAEVRHNWLDLIKNVYKYDAVFNRIPAFERAVSQVLRNIRVVRRKFMPKILAGEYERNLQQITTSLSDYLGRRGFPRDWPDSLEPYEIVVETEAGPLMVSPTGQFIVPSSYPGGLLVNFISKNLADADKQMASYKRNKHVERNLYKRCTEELRLSSLHKDDNVTPDLMIQCLEKLLENEESLRQLNGIHLNIATYYSVLKDGTVCIPWNFTL